MGEQNSDDDWTLEDWVDFWAGFYEPSEDR